MAVSTFYPDRYRISEDMERHSNRHCLTPFRELWLTACRLRSTQGNYTGFDMFCQLKVDGCMVDATIHLFVQPPHWAPNFSQFRCPETGNIPALDPLL